MNSRINAKLQLTNAALVAVLAVAGAATAQTLPKEGSYDFTSCCSGTVNVIPFSKTHFAFTYEQTCSNRSNPAGGLMDSTSSRCVGMRTSSVGKPSGTTECEVIDRDGDKQLLHLVATSDGKLTREVVEGTGKYEGIQMVGQALQSVRSRLSRLERLWIALSIRVPTS